MQAKADGSAGEADEFVYTQQFSTNRVICWSNGMQQKASEMGNQVCHQWKQI
jgi:hypothetical protein